jgi:hypothetical protein
MSQEDGTTPTRVYLASIYPVVNFEAWQRELHGARRALARLGVTRHWVFRGADDPREVMSILELPSREHAERLLASTDLNLSDWMDRIGLEIYPTFFVGEPVDVQEYPPPTPRAARPTE